MIAFVSSAIFPTKLFSSLKKSFHMSASVLMSVVKTKQSAAKRMIKTGNGGIKVGHANKSHLNGGKSRKQIRRLNSKVRLGGVWAKKMEKLLQN